MMKYLFLLFFIIKISPFELYAQLFTIQQCEEFLHKNNLDVLAQEYNISIHEAKVIQAKIWDQPYITVDFNLINPQDNRFFDVGNNGQKSLAVEQLIYLGGKKRKEVEFAQSNLELAKLEFEQLLRNLNLELKYTYFNLYFNLSKANRINEQLSNVDSLLTAYQFQANKGNVSLKDVVRLQSLSFSFKKELANLQVQIVDLQSNLKLLTNTNNNIIPAVDSTWLNNKYTLTMLYDEEDILHMALENNLENAIANKNIQSSQYYLDWQKTLAIPDVTVGANYDQRSGAFNNQVNLSLGFPIPLWNKQKGNIKIANNELKQRILFSEKTKKELLIKIDKSYKTYIFYKEQYAKAQVAVNQFYQVYDGVLKNFQSRNISFMEFTDFMESYNHSLSYIEDVQLELIIHAENLNYLINKKIF